MSTLNPSDTEGIGAFYERLSADAKTLLHLLATVYEGISVTEFTSRLSRSPFRKSDSTPFVADDVHALFTAIDKAQFGVFHKGRALETTATFLAGASEILCESESMQKILEALPAGRQSYTNSYSRFIRFRAAYWDANDREMANLFADPRNERAWSYWHEPPLSSQLILEIVLPFDADRFRHLPPSLIPKLVPMVHEVITWNLRYLDEWLRYLQAEDNTDLLVYLGDAFLLKFRLEEAMAVAERLLSGSGKVRQRAGRILMIAATFLKGDLDAAARQVSETTDLIVGARMSGVADMLLAIFLASQRSAPELATLQALRPKTLSCPFASALHFLKEAATPEPTKKTPHLSAHALYHLQTNEELNQLVFLLTRGWIGTTLDRKIKHWLGDLFNKHRKNDAVLGQAILLPLLASFECKTPVIEGRLPALPELGWLVKLKQPLEPWELSLLNLEKIAFHRSAGNGPTAGSANVSQSRLAWELECDSKSGRLRAVYPKEQQCRKGGQWSAGRAVSLKRLHDEGTQLPFVTEADTRVLGAIRIQRWEYPPFTLDPHQALEQLVGHPYVHRSDSPNQTLEIVRHTLKFILVEGDDGGAKISVQPALANFHWNDSFLGYTFETPQTISIVKLTKAEQDLISGLQLGAKSLSIPAAGKERLVSAITALKSQVNVFSDVEGAGSGQVKTVEPNMRLQLHLSPFLTGLRVALLAQPLRDFELFLPPGTGARVLFAEIEGHPYKTKRVLHEETVLASQVIAACPSLGVDEEESQPFLWTLTEPADCLELLMEIREIGEAVEVRWPQGERFRIASEVGASRLKMRVGSGKDWFEVSGELSVGEDKVLKLQELLDLLESDDSMGRFIKLQDGQFLALTREFRQRLEDLDAFTTSSKNGSRQLNPLAAHVIADLADETQAHLTKRWITHVEKLRSAATHQTVLPPTLQTELRPYQLEGFQWLARQAHWGVGACLADDMGLGKTIQALAILLHRATLGPALVVAPTSVTRNWLNEAARFAPTLRTRLFGPGDREEALQNLRGFDVIICTYGLLPNEIDKLEKVQWSTIVLDEAQAIKNAATQRWKAATQLHGDFKIITTGTPIENGLTELHALFQFINPGLLGSAQRFHVKFADPIARQSDDGARQRLKRLIRPFILRRLKNQVLKDLPARTDIVLQVEPSAEETAFYEALRRRAVERLTEMKEDENAGERSLRILAEIMKLRRACCHPQLVDSKISLGSSKLRLFGETVEERLANGHKVLVFSQFVDHLALIRGHLDKAGISYQYLDGSTPAKKRQEAVDAFQNGEGDIFLISLRAGGTGLNLTAADYVIHMDPWWNPAVEDQASDRAHRIGQQRSVTVYRLVVANTIEEKIVELHHQKRDLADSLLSGAETAGKLSPEQLLDLLRDER